MQVVLVVLIVAGLVPIALTLWANRHTSLLHAVVWALIAWLSWGLAFLLDDREQGLMPPGRYCALCLTGCAGVAVLGARRPHVFAWNFVVLSLFAVMVWPLIETQFLGTHTFDGLRLIFMAGTIAVGIVNYLPTRLGLAAFLLMLVGGGEIIHLYAPGANLIAEVWLFDVMLTFVPWIGWICLARRNASCSAFDRVWLDFRDRWGLVWSQRVREQFNHAAENAGWPAKLTWSGLTQETPVDQEKLLATLRATLQRFASPRKK